jgi:dTDP-4-amino-4,6-dideoxygalactose transaminase
MRFRDLKTQYFAQKDEIDTALLSTVASAGFIGGQPVRELEDELSYYVGVRNCITCGNGTDALLLALLVWGIGPGDAVFVPDFTFFSSGEVVGNVGATPVFVDVDEFSFNIDPEKLEEAIVAIEDEGIYKPRVVIAVDLFGLPADYPRIREICNQHSLLLLEDGAQGFGGSIGEKRACSFGDISTTSFFPAKPLGCYGDGGAVFTDNDDFAELVRSYAVHGKGSMKYDNVRIGMNSRLDTMQAAVLQVKLRAFEDYEVADVNRVADWYDKALADAGLVLPRRFHGFTSSWAQYTVQLPESCNRGVLQAELKQFGVPSMVYYPKPMHEQKAFSGSYRMPRRCSVTERLCKSVLSLPMGPYVTEADVVKVTNACIASMDARGL